MTRLILVALMIGWLGPLNAATKTLLIVGDSLSAAYGIDVSAGWVAQLQRRLIQNRMDYKIVNASISGDTTANGLARLPTLLDAHHPQIVVIELGGNDGLRGLSLPEMQHNIKTMVEKARSQGAKVLLLGIRLPPNYGKTYTERFHQVYEDVARESKVSLAPFILEGIATDRTLMQADGLHPDAEAQRKVLENVWAELKIML
jgi:acyl-CoA thioesterase I